MDGRFTRQTGRGRARVKHANDDELVPQWRYLWWSSPTPHMSDVNKSSSSSSSSDPSILPIYAATGTAPPTVTIDCSHMYRVISTAPQRAPGSPQPALYRDLHCNVCLLDTKSSAESAPTQSKGNNQKGDILEYRLCSPPVSSQFIVATLYYTKCLIVDAEECNMRESVFCAFPCRCIMYVFKL